MSDNKLKTIGVSSSKRIQIVDITDDVASFVRASGVSDGVCFVCVPHTTAAVTINENADPSVKSDILLGLEEIVPDNIAYSHAEGNSPAHIKSSIIGNTAEVLVEGGELVLGTWQGLYFCEFDGPRNRKVHLKVLEG